MRPVAAWLSSIHVTVHPALRTRRVVIANLVIAATSITGLVAWDLIGPLRLPLGVADDEGSRPQPPSTAKVGARG